VRRTRARERMNQKIRVPQAGSAVDSAYRPPRLRLVGYSPANRRPVGAAGPASQMSGRAVPPSGDLRLRQGIFARLRGMSPRLIQGTNPAATPDKTHKVAEKQQAAPVSTISTTKSPELFRVPERDRPLVAFVTDRPAIARKRKGKAKAKAKKRQQGRAKVRSPHNAAASSSRRRTRKAK
jgi:hypothetical protein